MGLPNELHPLQLAASSGGYEISQSLRFSTDEYLTRTNNTASTDGQYGTLSVWYKMDSTTASSQLRTIIEGRNGTYGHMFRFYTNKTDLHIGVWGSIDGGAYSAADFRDDSAWYHFLWQFDKTQSGVTNVNKLWVNGVAQSETSAGNFSSQNWGITNNGSDIHIGHYQGSGSTQSARLKGYIAEMHVVDGALKAATDFGEYDDNGVWRPIEYEGTYGNNGFYLKFDPSATNGIGHDHSGNGNNFTAYNFNTSGTGMDVMSDTPTKNWCTLNPLVKNNNLSEGNLVYNTATAETAYSTFGVSSGKWYCEVTCNNANTWFGIGTDPFLRLNSAASNQVLVGTGGGTVYSQNSTNTYDAGATWTTNDVIGIALDADNGGCIFYKNNTRILEWDSFTVDGPYFFGFDRENPTPTTTHTVNFGQRDFAYTPPTGYKALNTSNLPAPTVKDGSDYFNTVLYTGNATGRTISGVGFQADFLWNKLRDTGAQDHLLYDTVRGIGSNGNYVRVRSNTNTAEEDPATANQDLTAFTSDGFTIGTHGALNGNNQAYVTWLWKAGGSSSSNTDGSENSTVSANPTAGFSIVTMTTNGTTETYGHGLGVAPKVVLAKSRNNAGNWLFMTNVIGGSMKYGILNSTASFATLNYDPPTSTVFYYNQDDTWTNVAYCFAEVEGYSKISTYIGNGLNDGPFVYCGFRPSWVMWKRDGADGWVMKDVARSTYNVMSEVLYANLTNTESSTQEVDFLSNGFKIRTNSGASNTSGNTYVFMAFAENPFGGSGVTPATAR